MPSAKHPIFYKAIDTTGISQTGEEIARALIEVIEEIGAHKVVAVVSDNAPCMRLAWEYVEKEFPHIYCNGCAAHVANLIVNEICKETDVNDVKRNCNIITQYVKSRSALLHSFKAEQNHCIAQKLTTSIAGLVTPGDTRWRTQHLCMSRVRDNKIALVRLVDGGVFRDVHDRKRKDGSSPKAEFKALIQSRAFWSSVETVEPLLLPLSILIDEFESDSIDLSQVYRGFTWLMAHPLFQNNASILEIVMDKWVYIHTMSMAYAFFLNPKTAAGTKPAMHADDSDDVIVELIHLSLDKAAMKAELEQFTTMVQAPTPKQAVTIENMSPKQWWASSSRMTSFPLLAAVAARVFAIPSTSAASERVWSFYDFVRSKRRNCLGNETSMKLVKIYANGLSAFELCLSM
jgi:hypothetical protein